LQLTKHTVMCLQLEFYQLEMGDVTVSSNGHAWPRATTWKHLRKYDAMRLLPCT